MNSNEPHSKEKYFVLKQSFEAEMNEMVNFNLLSSADKRVRTANKLSHVQCQVCDFITQQISQA